MSDYEATKAFRLKAIERANELDRVLPLEATTQPTLRHVSNTVQTMRDGKADMTIYRLPCDLRSLANMMLNAADVIDGYLSDMTQYRDDLTVEIRSAKNCIRYS